MEFEVIKIEKIQQRILIEIEIIDTRKRKQYGYPIGEGWENEINGEPKFLKDIKTKLRDEEEAEIQSVDIEKIKTKLLGKKLKT